MNARPRLDVFHSEVAASGKAESTQRFIQNPVPSRTPENGQPRECVGVESDHGVTERHRVNCLNLDETNYPRDITPRVIQSHDQLEIKSEP